MHSPHTQQSPSSTVQASPLPTPHTVSVSLPHGTDRLRRSDVARTRSSIACSNCRRSKVRCENNGLGTTCSNCAKHEGRQCTYNESNAVAPNARRGSVSAPQDTPDDHLADPPKKRKRNNPILLASSAPKGSVGINVEILDHQLFGPSVWEELYAIFEQHYSTELPFLHKAQFLEKLRRANIQALVNPLASLLLAFLALTVPFHDQLVRLLCPGYEPDPIGMSLKYAKEARVRLSEPEMNDSPTMETVQALLMLGLHEKRNGQGVRYPITIGTAVVVAKHLGYHLQPDLDENPDVNKSKVKDQCEPLQPDEKFIREETKRRIMWSCFILDSYLALGKGRARNIQVDNLRIQLPCSQKAFDYGDNVKTRMLREDTKAFANRQDRNRNHSVRWEDDTSQEALVWFIKALDLCGDVVQWGCTISRRNEKLTPWHPQSTFYKLDTRLQSLKESLPQNLKISHTHTLVHISNRTSTSYTLLHAVISLCSIGLHREYLPFLPWEIEPCGPIDGPFTDDFRSPKPSSFWKDSAEKCFKSTKEFLDLLVTCHERGMLVETPFTGFVLFTVGFTVLWCAYFPKMDHEGHVCDKGASDDDKLKNNLWKVGMLLDRLWERMTMARSWRTQLCEMVPFYKDRKKEWDAVKKKYGWSPGSDSSSSTDEASGKGHEHYQTHEKRIKEFGDHTRNEALERTPEQGTLDLHRLVFGVTEDNGSYTIKSEDRETQASTPGAKPTSQLHIPPTFTTINSQSNSPSANGNPIVTGYGNINRHLPTYVNGNSTSSLNCLGPDHTRGYDPSIHTLNHSYSSGDYPTYLEHPADAPGNIGQPGVGSTFASAAAQTVPDQPNIQALGLTERLQTYYSHHPPYVYSWNTDRTVDSFAIANDLHHMNMPHQPSWSVQEPPAYEFRPENSGP